MIVTGRLVIRPFSLNDAAESFTWFGDSEVMKFVPNGPDKNRMQTESRLINYIKHYETLGYSKYVITDKKDGKLIGDCGILAIENTGLNELGYRITRESWGNGFATEAAIGVLNHTFRTLKFNEIHAIIESENIVSKYIAESKLGFSRNGNIYCHGCDFELYRLGSENFMNYTTS
ncbi:MAG TPA: GNAT family N-acetyltransferase [Spirochaetota bacterium]|nr:GNAT family N-acetyltransferase [Spirochaetota bacterium]